MDKNLKALEPQAVWRYFSEICAIPHPSHHEEAIRDYIVRFAREHSIEHTVDEVGNIIMRKPATAGMEDRKGVILQAHLDMVPQKNSDKTFDFENDPIEAYIDGDWVTANGTTLGADNGMGVAAILAVMASDTLPHGDIEALLTASEEVGMDGAFGLKACLLRGEILMNLDSETEGELYVGCAGGLDANITFAYTEDKAPSAVSHRPMRIEVKGLKGGHSGIEIVLERANANKVLNRFLKLADKKYSIHLSRIDGGGLRNAIPREAMAELLIPVECSFDFINDVAEFEKLIIEEFRGVEDNISIKACDVEMPLTIIDNDTQRRLINAIYACPNGVMRMSNAMKGLVQTSTNLARVVSKEGKIELQCLMRSTSRSEKEDLGEMICSVFDMAEATTTLSGGYDGWNPNMDSPILHTMIDGYKALYGCEPAITAIHAGLECGIIAGAYPDLDMISFGPTICFPHSPDEKVHIKSVERFWEFLTYSIKNAPRK